MQTRIQSALLSVYHKDGLDKIVQQLHRLKITIYATGGTFDFIKEMGIPVIAVEDITGYPSILDGRVKTLHPGVFGGILARRSDAKHQQEMEQYKLPFLDLVVVDLYPFESTVASTSDEKTIIEKIDIGGISLIRAAAKNFNDVLIIPSVNDYGFLLDILEKQEGNTDLSQRKRQAQSAFNVSSRYDTAIHSWFEKGSLTDDIQLPSSWPAKSLRYGENPHQQAAYHGNIEEVFSQLHGKELSYNNLLDVDAALSLIHEFSEPTFAIIKHNNACGLACDNQLTEAWKKALAGDPVSAFGGVIVCNRKIDLATAEEINKLFFEVLMAPDFDADALELLKSKKNRVLLQTKPFSTSDKMVRSLLNGVLEQTRDSATEQSSDLKTVTVKIPSSTEVEDLLFANKIVKHSKSNAIVLAKNGQLLASGVGQTSRVDALKHAIEKANAFGFKLQGAVMASDAFFPFADCIQIAADAGITSIVQPGGSIKDQDVIDEANKKEVSMVITGIRHFKH